MKASDQYQHKTVEKKWREAWERVKLDTPRIEGIQGKPFYNLMMFPYPSAEGLHVGNMYAFTGSDIYGRFKRMQGYDVFEPIGLDGFGIHSENYALKVGRHPMDHAVRTQENFYNQLHTIGAMYDWTRTVETYDPDYYRWTQWLFVQMFKHGLAYRGKAQVNWCPSCKTVLADEQVIDNACERCGKVVEKRLLEQWFFRITAYAGKLLDNSFSLDWSEKVKVAQKNWIGKKEGTKILFGDIEIFTTRPDTIFGATFVVLAPSHKLAGKVKEVVNPATKKPVPVFVDEYVLGEVGTGAIMGVPAFDERDMTFAKKMGLPVVRAKLTDKIFGEKVTTYHLRDWLISRQRYWGPPIPMIYCENCAKECRGERTDMPGWHTVSEKDLPVVLPRIDDYKPGDDGIAPLAKHKEFYHVACPACGRTARRETDVSDTFLDSSWYFLRYPSVNVGNPKSHPPAGGPNPKQIQNPCLAGRQAKSKSLDIGNWSLDIPWDREVTRHWLPVHMYTGGAEHSVLHLMYSRFVWMALRDWGYLDFSGEAGSRSAGDEPFTKFYAHGLVIKDGAKMSKSKGNVVNPDEYIVNYGADALRLYLMFTGPYDQGGDFRDSAMEGMARWVGKVWRIAQNSIAQHSLSTSATIKKSLHRAIKKVGEDIERRRYNTAIASMMVFVNAVVEEGGILSVDELRDFLKILAPFAPYMTEELWQKTQDSGLRTQDRRNGSQYTFTKSNSIHFQPWPAFDPNLLEEGTVRIIVQVNGKLRDTVLVSRQSSVVQQDVEQAARSSANVAKHLAGQTVKTVIFVSGKLVNFVLEPGK